MVGRDLKRSRILTGMLLLCFLGAASQEVRAEMSSSNFKITSDVIGSFGSQESSSNFNLGDTGGEVGTGDGSSTNFNLSAGFWGVVGDDGVLVFNITSGLVNLGTFDTSQVKYGTAAFNVATTAQGGYQVYFDGNSLSFEGNSIDALSSADTSDPGTEQFGFNLVANSAPAIGVDPAGGIGQASPDYNTPNSFKFAPGDVIAQAAGPSSQTNFTMSFIANVAPGSEAGEYFSNITVAATGRY